MNRAHGTRACYAAGCRQPECCQANTAAEVRRRRLKLYGQWHPYVDATPAREHLQALSRAGIGHRRASELSGISGGSISRILYGGPDGRPPTRQIRPETERAILAVEPSLAALAASAPVDGTGTRRRMQALVALGWSQARLCKRLGVAMSSFTLIMGGSGVTAATARAARVLYGELWNAQPDASDHRSRISVNRARNYAAARGWPPPLGWDDGAIDDPAAGPAEGWQRPSRLAPGEFAEEAAEVLALEDGNRHLAAARLGMSKNTFDQAYARARRAS